MYCSFKCKSVAYFYHCMGSLDNSLTSKRNNIPFWQTATFQISFSLCGVSYTLKCNTYSVSGLSYKNTAVQWDKACSFAILNFTRFSASGHIQTLNTHNYIFILQKALTFSFSGVSVSLHLMNINALLVFQHLSVSLQALLLCERCGTGFWATLQSFWRDVKTFRSEVTGLWWRSVTGDDAMEGSQEDH